MASVCAPPAATADHFTVPTPTGLTTCAGTVTDGGAVWTCAGHAGSANFIFFLTGANALTDITVAASTVAIPTVGNGAQYFDLRIAATASGYDFSVNNETVVSIANTAALTGTPGFACRNDHSLAGSNNALRLRNFGFYGNTRL